jgi:hypothetical protein
MKLVRCNNKHFYDSDTFDECPHCEEIENEPGLKQVSFEEAQARRNDEFFDIGMEETPPPLVMPAQVSANSPAASRKTPSQQSLQSLVSAAVAAPQEPEDEKTVAFYDFGEEEPVVGWVVFIGGEYTGQCFNLKTGTNFIGRAMTLDIPLAKDGKVSRDKHAIITYDPESRTFFAQPGEGRGLTYRNGTLLLAPTPLEHGDKFKLGGSEFLFIPLCGEDFVWEDYFD